MLLALLKDGAGAVHATTKTGSKERRHRDWVWLATRVDRRIAFFSLRILFDFENSHHAVVFMVQDVAVEHPLSWIVVVANDDAGRRVLGDVQHVLPGTVRLGHAVAIEDLELKTVKMERVIHPNDILDLPDLSRANSSAHINPRHVHRLAIDQTLAEYDCAHRGDFRRIEWRYPSQSRGNRDGDHRCVARRLERQEISCNVPVLGPCLWDIAIVGKVL